MRLFVNHLFCQTTRVYVIELHAKTSESMEIWYIFFEIDVGVVIANQSFLLRLCPDIFNMLKLSKRDIDIWYDLNVTFFGIIKLDLKELSSERLTPDD